MDFYYLDFRRCFQLVLIRSFFLFDMISDSLWYYVVYIYSQDVCFFFIYKDDINSQGNVSFLYFVVIIVYVCYFRVFINNIFFKKLLV